MRRCEDEKVWRRTEDETMWRWENLKRNRCEDVKVRRWEDEKIRRCMWKWEGVMTRCDDRPPLLEEPFAQTLSGERSGFSETKR